MMSRVSSLVIVGGVLALLTACGDEIMPMTSTGGKLGNHLFCSIDSKDSSVHIVSGGKYTRCFSLIIPSSAPARLHRHLCRPACA